MKNDDRVVTAKLPGELAAELDVAAQRIDRSRSWIIRQALSAWLDEEQRRLDLTLEALEQVDAGQIVNQDQMLEWAATKQSERRKRRCR